MPDVKELTVDYAALTDGLAARRYFAKFRSISDHLLRVSDEMVKDGALNDLDAGIIASYVERLANTFQALGHKYLLTGRDTGKFFGSLSMDRVESGFPVHREILTMANDAQQAARHLAGLPSVEKLKDDMIRQIVGDLTPPTKLQFAMSQRLYYKALQDKDLFWVQNDPEALWQENTDRRTYVVHWAVYDSQTNLPTIYLMDVEDSGRGPLPRDERRWPEVQNHLIAQSLAGLKVLTIAKGFDEDFDDLHPKRLRRIHVGPMYSNAFTKQTGPLREVLAEANSPVGEDWALAWTIEDLLSESVKSEKSGWFSTVEREVYALDPFAGRGADTGASSISRSLIMPERPYQVLAEKNPAGFGQIRKFVVSPKGRVISHR
ncbi:MAG: hypothetical protein P8Q99_08415 [Paracoccaceae bacterium]|nr:hypothetical protein [Paracoccaceae bacterium]